MNTSAPILLVEDDENDVLLTQIALEIAGIPNPLRVISSGYEAVRYLNSDGIYADRTKFPIPRLVLLDLNLPVLTGFQVLEWLQRHPHAPKVVIVVLSASPDPADIAKAKALGAADYRIKPTNSAHLVSIFRELEARWLKPDQSPDTSDSPSPTPPPARSVTTHETRAPLGYPAHRALEVLCSKTNREVTFENPIDELIGHLDIIFNL